MEIPYLSLQRVTAMHASEIEDAVNSVVRSGWYLQGNAVHTFERQYADYIGTKECVSCANGLDALTLILRAYKELGRLHDGDEVIVPANTYIATILSITENGLKPVLVEPSIPSVTNTSPFQIDDRLIEQAITERTRAVMIVHLYGFCAYSERIGEVCKRHNLLLIEDNAQAHGCSYNGRKTGSIGDAAAHSFYPGKNLGALGDAGAVTTQDSQLAQVVRTLANYGSSRKYIFDYEGCNSRMDEIQASVLSIKLHYLDEDNARRRELAKMYLEKMHNIHVTLPVSVDCIAENMVFHVFPVLCDDRDRLQAYLKEKGVGTMIHYPLPPHLQDCYRAKSLLYCADGSEAVESYLPITELIHRQELSLPLNQTMTKEEAQYVIDAINSFS